jgi:diguanylate cyclase (GGDEF)-like protein
VTKPKGLLEPLNLLRALVLVTTVALVGVGVVVLIVMGALHSGSVKASRSADTALLAVESEAQLAKLRDVLHARIFEYQTSPEVAALSPERKLALTQELQRTDDGAPASGTDQPQVPLSMSETLAMRDAEQFLSKGYGAFADDGVRAVGTLGKEALENYYAEPSPGNLRLLLVRLDALLAELDTRGMELASVSTSQHGELLSTVSSARLEILLTLAGTGLLMLLLGRHIAGRVRQLIEGGSKEQLDLAVATAHLQFRNDQLNALYNVFTEITDTLSLDYVVRATLRESLNIMRADMAVLRILRGANLEAAGALSSTGQEIGGLSIVKLGEGPTGRTAKRGRTLRIDSNGEQMMVGQAGTAVGMSPSEQTKRSPMESGLIVPLVVGARVVGTLACWSRNENAFNDEDQRVLEMMASQVATAIAAADATESSDRQAHQDALTSLPNRRQLDDDLRGSLAELSAQSRNAVVAMLDIDFFKRLNDKHGHLVGDATLQKVASVLRNSVREGDYVYRFGGEEFVLIFADVTVVEAIQMAERLRGAIQALRLTGENQEPVGPVTVSIGLSLLPDHGTDVSDLIDLADKAMYQAKTSGRNRVEVWDAKSGEAVVTVDSVA